MLIKKKCAGEDLASPRLYVAAPGTWQEIGGPGGRPAARDRRGRVLRWRLSLGQAGVARARPWCPPPRRRPPGRLGTCNCSDFLTHNSALQCKSRRLRDKKVRSLLARLGSSRQHGRWLHSTSAGQPGSEADPHGQPVLPHRSPHRGGVGRRGAGPSPGAKPSSPSSPERSRAQPPAW